jgi:hypothetical protein
MIEKVHSIHMHIRSSRPVANSRLVMHGRLVGRSSIKPCYTCRCTAKEAETSQPATGFTPRYTTAYSMAELYAKDRPKAIPLTEFEQRRKKKDAQEIVDAAVKKKGKAIEAEVREGLAALEALLPDLVNLFKMKPIDWATIALDVEQVAAKLVSLKTIFPVANAFKIVSKTPKMLLRSTADVTKDAQKVKEILSSLPDPDAIIEAVPELVDPTSLARALSTIRGSFPNQDPLQVWISSTPCHLARRCLSSLLSHSSIVYRCFRRIQKCSSL